MTEEANHTATSATESDATDLQSVSDPLLKELQWRGLIHQCTDVTGLEKLLSEGPQTVYIGFDPTADSLHIGSMMQLMLLRRFQTFGHRPIALVGGATGMIGDPSGKSEERNLLDAEQLQRNVAGVEAQMRQFLDFDTDQNPAILLNNYQWMQNYSYLHFLRDVGKNFPIGAMLGKESVRARLESSAGLSYTEFSYMLLQAFDFVQLAKEHGCRIQAGGSDQWGNVTAGIDLGRRMLGQSLFGITAPLLLTSEGKKMGKTEKGSVWLDPKRTSPYAFYQYWMRVDDADVMRCIAYLTEIDREEYQTLQQSVVDEPHARAAQKRLAQWMTQFVHGDAGLERAQTASKILFGGAFERMSDEDLVEIFADVPNHQFARSELEGEGVWVVDALNGVQLTKSSSEARRAVKEGSVMINNVKKVDSFEYRITAEDLASESVVVIRKGKKNYALLRFM